jgi:N-carbamoyl-L-amino-acid hydrolase
MNRRTFLQHSAAIVALPHVSFSRPAPLKRTLLRVNGARLNASLTGFGAIGRTAGGTNRVAYSEADLAGRAFTLDLIRQAGLTPRIDAAGNIHARLAGTNAALPPVMIGSHVDSVTDGGNYDGPVGTFAAIEVARSLREQKIALRHSVDVVVWQNEEGGTIGSKLAVGLLTDADLSKVARSGKTIREGITLVGGDPAALASVVMKKGDIACYIEMHIEQSGLLEKAGIPIGVVQGIVGLRWLEVTITGFANHAGATAMDQRQDAVLAAAKFTVAVNDAIRAEPGRQVATVGRIVATPNTTNVIAGQVVLTVDLRDLDDAKLTRFEAAFTTLARDIGAATNTTFAIRTLVASEPALADTGIMQAIEASATPLGLRTMRLPSGAGHDAQELARIAPIGMIFVPSIGGISHSPKEFSKPDDIAHGADVLLNTVVAIDKA